MRTLIVGMLLLLGCDGTPPHDCETSLGLLGNAPVSCQTLEAFEDRFLVAFAPVWPESAIKGALPGILVRLPPPDKFPLIQAANGPYFYTSIGPVFGLYLDGEIWIADPDNFCDLGHEFAHAMEDRVDHVGGHDDWGSKGIDCAIRRMQDTCPGMAKLTSCQ
jgi:hypothetical protein